jgi:hypothetical protein
MESATEKYPVCPQRNTTAAFRWFYQPASAIAFLQGRPARRPVPAALLARPRTEERALER